jgi:O-acetyl-ADP-ribose deacetylase (regulator of RNase III)
MTRLIEITGDMFTSEAPARAQGVNTDGVMGHGIAPIFKRLYPGMYSEYRALCLTGELQPGETHIWHGAQTVYNAASQDRPGRNARLEWLESSLRIAFDDADDRSYDRIAMPLIGCGIGGLEWSDVRPVIIRLAETHLADAEVWFLPSSSLSPVR